MTPILQAAAIVGALAGQMTSGQADYCQHDPTCSVLSGTFLPTVFPSLLVRQSDQRIFPPPGPGMTYTLGECPAGYEAVLRLTTDREAFRVACAKEFLEVK